MRYLVQVAYRDRATAARTPTQGVSQMNRSQSAAAAAIARAEAEPRPHTADLAVALHRVQMWVADYDRVSARCGGVWTAAQLRRVTRNLANAIDAADATV